MTTEPQSFTLRYTPGDSGQVMFNDPRISEAFAIMSYEANVLIDTVTITDGREAPRVSVFYAEEDVKHGVAGANIVVHDRTPLRAIRRALGWHFGSHELINHSYSTGRTFTASSLDDTIDDQEGPHDD